MCLYVVGHTCSYICALKTEEVSRDNLPIGGFAAWRWVPRCTGSGGGSGGSGRRSSRSHLAGGHRGDGGGLGFR